MRIVHTESSCGWGGQEIRIIEESIGLMSRGHSVTIVCPRESELYKRAKEKTIEVVSLPISKKSFFGLLAACRWLSKSSPIDVINTHSSTDSWIFAISMLVMRQKTPIVRTRHISARVSGQALNRWLYGKSASVVVTTGEAIKRELIEVLGLDPQRVVSVPTGISEQRFFPREKVEIRSSLGLDGSLFYFGILATLRSWKGHLYLLEAFKELSLPNARLLIIGDGPMRTVITNKIALLNLGDHVEMVGQQSNPELWLGALDVLCLPSYANEGVPQAILQAMFAGVPVVTTSTGAISEAIKSMETGIVVQPKSTADLRQGMQTLFFDETLASRLAMNARRLALERFSYGRMLDSMEMIFQNTARGDKVL